MFLRALSEALSEFLCSRVPRLLLALSEGSLRVPVFLAANYFFAKTRALSEYRSSCYLICTIVGNSITPMDNLYHRCQRPGLSQSTCALVILFAPL